MECLHCVGDVEGTGQTQSQIFETSFDLPEEGVHSFAFLQADHNIWGLIFGFFDFSGNVKHGVSFRGSSFEIRDDGQSLFVIASSSTS